MGEKRILLCLILFVIGFVSAANIGISPASLNFNNVMRGGYSESSFMVSCDSESLMNVSFESYGEISEWINYSDDFLLINSGKMEELKVWVVPPVDIPNGNYTGYLRVRSSSNNDELEGHAVGIIQSTIDLKINVVVTDDEIKKCVASDFSVMSSEKGEDIIFSFNIKNNGNILISPKVFLNIFDDEKIEMLKNKEFIAGGISPTKKEHFEFRVNSNDLDISQYWTEISVPECEGSDLLTFDILKEGMIQSKGVLLNILMNKNGKVGEVVPIEIGFKNTGDKDVFAKFLGTVSFDGEIVSYLESDEIEVQRGKISKFNLHFNPEKKGRYIVSGKVIYNGKRTYEKSSSVEILSSGLSVNYLVYGIFILMIFVLLYKIREEKNKIRRKLK